MNEAKLLKKVLWVSLVAHLVVFFWRFEYRPSRSLSRDTTIEASLVSLHELNEQTFPIKQENKIDRKSMPQLPKNFSVVEKRAKPQLVSDVAEPKESKKKKSKTIELRDKKKIQLAKEDALQRLIREKARRSKKFKPEPETIKLTKSLRARKKELESKNEQTGFGQGDGSYHSVVKQWVSSHYSLPKTYDYSDLKKKTIIQLQLSQKGQILELKLIQSSQSSVFDRLAMDTLRNAEPFPTPPKDWIGKSIVFPFDFFHQ